MGLLKARPLGTVKWRIIEPGSTGSQTIDTTQYAYYMSVGKRPYAQGVNMERGMSLYNAVKSDWERSGLNPKMFEQTRSLNIQHTLLEFYLDTEPEENEFGTVSP